MIEKYLQGKFLFMEDMNLIPNAVTWPQCNVLAGNGRILLACG